ncbi:MAG TPA: hypothetical protein V6C81_23115 [Planktothrix sp.]
MLFEHTFKPPTAPPTAPPAEPSGEPRSNRNYFSGLKRLEPVLAQLEKHGVKYGTTLVFSACLVYALFGFSAVVFFLWFTGLVLAGCELFLERAVTGAWFDRTDCLIALALFAIALPLFTWSVYTIPWQVLTDESNMIRWEQLWIKDNVFDLFGTSPYLGFPYFPLLVRGWLDAAAGGIDLFHDRFMTGICASTILSCAYLFYRLLQLRRLTALTGAILICFCHSFFAIARLAFKDNGAVLYELLALSMLFYGFRQRCPFVTYVGGIFAGLCLYQYYPARIIFPLWMAFVVVAARYKPVYYSLSKIKRLIVLFFLGLIMSGLPLATATVTEKIPEHLGYQRASFIIFPEGREAERRWFGQKDFRSAWMINFTNGLKMFNCKISDGAGQYDNECAGFLDPCSGVLLWVGLLVVILFRRSRLESILMITGFLIQMVFFCCLVYKTPDYTRLLVILPFVEYFVAVAIEAAALLVVDLLALPEHNRLLTLKLLPALVLVAICTLNFQIYYQYIQDGLTQGNDNGDVARYIGQRRERAEYLFLLAADKKHPYFNFDSDSAAKLQAFAHDPQQSLQIKPSEIDRLTVFPPFTLFMNNHVWQANQKSLHGRYPHAVAHELRANQSIAFEDPESATPLSSWKLVANRDDILAELSAMNDKGQYSELVRLFGHILDRPDASLLDDYYRASILTSVACAYERLGDYRRAKDCLIRSLQLNEKYDSPDFNYCALLSSEVGDDCANENQWDSAVVYYSDALRLRKRSDLPTSQTVVADFSDYLNLAKAYLREEKYSQAAEALSAAEAALPLMADASAAKSLNDVRSSFEKNGHAIP